ncbi:MAG: hypothetical protein COB09_00175 [Thalassobium sp.]|nr:MAG: hypothetical protein COB09_00175 [Thalassobium sp.]
MKRTVLSILVFLLGLMSYFITFNAFYESWFPYYYEDYIGLIFQAGAVLILISPCIVALIQKSKSAGLLAFLPLFHKATIIINLTVFVVCVITFLYMLSNGSFLSGAGGVYTIESK